MRSKPRRKGESSGLSPSPCFLLQLHTLEPETGQHPAPLLALRELARRGVEEDDSRHTRVPKTGQHAATLLG